MSIANLAPQQTIIADVVSLEELILRAPSGIAGEKSSIEMVDSNSLFITNDSVNPALFTDIYFQSRDAVGALQNTCYMSGGVTEFNVAPVLLNEVPLRQLDSNGTGVYTDTSVVNQYEYHQVIGQNATIPIATGMVIRTTPASTIGTTDALVITSAQSTFTSAVAVPSLSVAGASVISPTILSFDIPDTIGNLSGAVLPFITATVVGGKYQIILNARIVGNAGSLSSVTGTISNGAYSSVSSITMTAPSINEYYVCLTACFTSTTANVNITLTAISSGTWDVGTPSQYTMVRLA
jgi:hypothetical protein